VIILMWPLFLLGVRIGDIKWQNLLKAFSILCGWLLLTFGSVFLIRWISRKMKIKLPDGIGSFIMAASTIFVIGFAGWLFP